MQRKQISLLTESPGMWEMELEESIQLQVCLHLRRFLTLPHSPSSPSPYPHALHTPFLPLFCPGNLTLILGKSTHKVPVCMIPETAEFKEKATNQEKEKVHKDRGRTEGWEEVCWSDYLVINT